ncbi:hypothetical protein [Aurantibacillus circumpalustris]|uniref:hypothetical protein n=1 Tax=Aurantibacillus circumpalustris TaxID=3036359 RepID=UPI00295BE10D|nr:hypothetical protein [Aurantibacillus circumpalustris]
MEEIDVNTYLFKENLFDLFKEQLKKDFEGAGANSDFTGDLPRDLEALKLVLLHELKIISNNSSTLIASLLYRIDISEIQIRNYQLKNSSLSFEEVLAELIIKRILQKVILKKTYSTKNG